MQLDKTNAEQSSSYSLLFFNIEIRIKEKISLLVTLIEMSSRPLIRFLFSQHRQKKKITTRDDLIKPYICLFNVVMMMKYSETFPF